MRIFSLDRDKIRGIIFDIDLTLYDNHHYYASQETLLIARVAQELGRPEGEVKHELKEYRKQVTGQTGNRPALGPSIGALYGITVEQISDWREELFHPEKYLSRDEKLIGVLERLAKNFQIAAVTNNPTSIGKRTLRVLEVADYFSHVVGIDVTGVSKPTIAPFSLVVEKFGCRHENVVSIGDRYEVDLHLPLQHGMGGILVEKLEDVYQLPDILSRDIMRDPSR